MARALAALLFLLAPGIAQAQDLARAERLIAEGRPKEALEILAPLEARYAGRPAYDYLLGVAALESGEPSLATFVLERVLAVDPRHTAARLEMARGYFSMGDDERARREFEAVLRAGPAPSQRAVIERYLERIAGRAHAPAARVSGDVEAALGRDSNVNAAGSAGGVLTATPQRGRESGTYLGLGAALAYTHEIDGAHTLFASASLSGREHLDLDGFDWRAADLRAGVRRRLAGGDRLQLSLVHDEYDSEDIGRRRIQGIAADWTRAFGARADIGLFAEALRIRYRAAHLQDESSDLLFGGVRGTRALEASGRTRASASAYAGQDAATGARPDGDRRLLGADVTLAHRLASAVEARLSFVASQSDYDSARRDRYVSARIGASWRFERRWLLSPELSRTHNRSSVPSGEYGRTEISVAVRRELP
jgi:outer membrane protein